MLGPENSATAHFAPLTKHETILLTIVVILVVGLGIFSDPILQLSNNAIDSLLATTR
jgi:NADH:ubiquinone oxidoreductase subunit 4 (subunit M)